MIGSIIGDIVGSIYEFNNIKSKDFEFFEDRKDYTDDSVLTVATADWLLNGGKAEDYYYKYALKYPTPMGSYGNGFVSWVLRGKIGDLSPYNSCGNGSAMRVGPVGWAFDTKEDVMRNAKMSAQVTHNHAEGIKGAQATALCIMMSRKGCSKEEIRREVESTFKYDLDFTCDEIRPTYDWGATCQDTVPQAIVCVLDACSFEDAVRNAISLGGDSDTLGCITGSIAEAMFGVPEAMYVRGTDYLDDHLKSVLVNFEDKFGNNVIR